MILRCPECQFTGVVADFPDATKDKSVKCPECSSSFPTEPAYASSVARAFIRHDREQAQQFKAKLLQVLDGKLMEQRQAKEKSKDQETRIEVIEEFRRGVEETEFD